MNSPKEALEAISTGLVAAGEVPYCTWGNEVRAMKECAKAAIPVAELEGQAVDLLGEAGYFSDEISGAGSSGINFVNKCRGLFTKLEALK